MNTTSRRHQYGKPAPGAKTLEYSGFSGPMFGNVLTAVQFINSSASTRRPCRRSTPRSRVQGPDDAQVGELKCNVPPYVSVCGVQMGIRVQGRQGRASTTATTEAHRRLERF
jgi:hypothetical protein